MDKQPISTKVIEEAFHKYYEGLHRYAYSLTGENETAKDIVQQVFIALWERKEKIIIKDSVKSYLFRAIHNRCINHHTRVRKFLVLDHHTENIEGINNNYTLENNEVQNQIKAAIEKLPPQCKAVFLKNREEEKTYSQVAGEMGIAVKTVEAQMTKALKILREELAAFLFCLIIIVSTI